MPPCARHLALLTALALVPEAQAGTDLNEVGAVLVYPSIVSVPGVCRLMSETSQRVPGPVLKSVGIKAISNTTKRMNTKTSRSNHRRNGLLDLMGGAT